MVDTYSTKSQEKLFAKSCPIESSVTKLPVFSDVYSIFGKHSDTTLPTPASIPLRQSKQNIIPLSKQTTELLISIKEVDTHAYIHSTNHAAHVYNFTTYLSLSEKDTNQIYLASLLHDVGKLFYADLFTLPRKLSYKEMSMMQEHVYASYIILKQNMYSQFIALSGLHHHRYFAETDGYPKNEQVALENITIMCTELNADCNCPRLTKDDIKMNKHEKYLLSIIVLLDSLDAILDQNRKYKLALKLSQVEAELEPYWGNKYNSELKKPFLEYIDWLLLQQYELLQMGDMEKIQQKYKIYRPKMNSLYFSKSIPNYPNF